MISVVVPTLGRDSLGDLLAALVPQLRGYPETELILVDDRRDPAGPLEVGAAGVQVLAGPGAGPAAARNTGWRAARHPWVAFLDDDVVPAPDWLAALHAELSGADGSVGGVQGVLSVPLPGTPDDWAANTATLADGAWITADMAYRRAALAEAGGFDERFPRAFREDAEIAYRVRRAGWRLERGHRRSTHPVRPEGPWVSLRSQRGNADDALLRRLYGPGWRGLLEIPAGRRRRHAVVTATGAGAAGLAAMAVTAGRYAARPARLLATGAALLGGAWLAGTAEFLVHRVRRAPGSLRRPVPLLFTSVAIPPLAVGHWLAGWWRHRHATAPRATASAPDGPATTLTLRDLHGE